jgi:hypothetical protein
MILRKRAVLTIITILTVLLFINDSHSIERGRDSISNRRYLLLVDSGFINCPLCLNSFTKFIEAVNANGLEKSFLGVIIFEKEKNELFSRKNIQIIEKQLRGFISGNNIKFPFILDTDGVFNDPNLDDVTLILFDIQEKIIKKYKFPLTKEQLDEISKEKEK